MPIQPDTSSLDADLIESSLKNAYAAGVEEVIVRRAQRELEALEKTPEERKNGMMAHARALKQMRGTKRQKCVREQYDRQWRSFIFLPLPAIVNCLTKEA